MSYFLIPGFAAALAFAAAGALAEESDGAAQDREPTAAQVNDAEAANEESAYRRRLSHARREHEASQTARREKREAERLREQEVTRLQGAQSTLGRRESRLRHEEYWTRREYDSMARDPSDLSALARRDTLERELTDLRLRLDAVVPAYDSAARRLDALRLR